MSTPARFILLWVLAVFLFTGCGPASRQLCDEHTGRCYTIRGEAP